MIQLAEHPLRRQVVGEMHLRRWPPLAAPSLVVQVLRLVDAEERAAEEGVLANLPTGWAQAPSDNPRHHEGRTAAGHGWVWEQHNEASALTLFVPLKADAPARRDDLDLAEALDWIGALPGKVMRATRITLVEDERQAASMLPALDFFDDELVSCHLGAERGAQARIWSDFRIGKGQFGQLLVAANGMSASDLSRRVQRLQELGNYRNLALLGLATARSGWPRLDRIEQDLIALAGTVASPDADDEALLTQVCALSLELMAQSTIASFRMGATAAYARLVDDRLAELAPREIAGFQSLADFTQRRLQPAVRTCAALVEREAELSGRAAAFVSLLRTRIETRIEAQNARLLESMERSTGLQLRMQQLVEGLSVVALSYYCLGVLGYVLKGWEAADHHFPAYQALAVLTPLVVVAVAIGMHRLKHSLLHLKEPEA